MKLLIVEDEQSLVDDIRTYLEQEGYLCESASDYALASEKIALYNYDCIIVDISLPDGTGLNIIRELKENYSRAGIIIISAKNAIDDKVAGLDLGADDYLAKPFDLSELNARIKALMRRNTFDGRQEIILNEIKVVMDSAQVYVHDEQIDLTKMEYDLLIFFLSNRNRVLTKEAIAEHLWGDHMDLADSYDFVYTHIRNLRKKIRDHDGRQYIRNIYGIGYKFVAP